MYLLDTNTCSYIFRTHPASVAVRFSQARTGEIGLSTVVLAELHYGAALLANGERLRAYIREFAAGLLVLPWNARAAEHYGDLRATLQRKGTPIGSMDLMIAAHARSLDAVLVTNNQKHFRRIPGLKLENWV